MTIEARVISDSITIEGQRITTFVLKYPRFIHSEFMTHRQFSRNASSSRAIPFKKKAKGIIADMAMPLEFRKNQKGMKAGDKLTPFRQKIAKITWRLSGYTAITFAYILDKLGVHKQYVNRITEPFDHISVILTSTTYDNFFSLRIHSAAQPEIRALAERIHEEYQRSKPILKRPGQWHLPFVSWREIARADYSWSLILSAAHDAGKINPLIDLFEDGTLNRENVAIYLPLVKKSVARCARVSYNNHDGTPTTQEQDEALWEKLVNSTPIHASAAEHQARSSDYYTEKGNLDRGWGQYRKMLRCECSHTFIKPLR